MFRGTAGKYIQRLSVVHRSARIVGDPLTSIVDLPLELVLNGKLVSVGAWYDNEMGYSIRLAETATRLAVQMIEQEA